MLLLQRSVSGFSIIPTPETLPPPHDDKKSMRLRKRTDPLILLKNIICFYFYIFLLQEILNSIVEHGALFKELEYRNAVLLLQRSSSGFDQKQKQKQLKKLEEIMMEAV